MHGRSRSRSSMSLDEEPEDSASAPLCPSTTATTAQGYLAPEMLQRQAYNKAVDVWALGVIVFVLLCGCLPFDDDSKRLNRAGAMQVLPAALYRSSHDGTRASC